MMKWLSIAGLLGATAIIMSRSSRRGALPAEGEAAPDFSLADQSGVQHRLKDYAGRWLVLYFYPRDDTPGCTREACAFRDDFQHLRDMGAQVIGISVDNTRSHARFATKYQLPFPLLADERGAVAARYGALLDLMVVRMARRQTFLIDPQGKVCKVYSHVDTKQHSREVMEDLSALLARK